MAEELKIDPEGEEAVDYFVLDNGRLLEATKLSAALTVSDDESSQTETLEVRVVTPDVVMEACCDLYLGANAIETERLHELILSRFGNPKPDDPNMWHVMDWHQLMHMSVVIQPTVLREQSVDLDTDVLYTKQGARAVQGTKIDSPERKRIEMGMSPGRGTTSQFWSPPICSMRQYFSNLWELNPLAKSVSRFPQTNWELLRAAAEMDGVLDVSTAELFGRATCEPFPIIVPFDEEEAWRWRCQEIDSFRCINEKLDTMERMVIQNTIEDAINELSGLQGDERAEMERKLHILELFLNDSQALPGEDRTRLEEALREARSVAHNLMWRKAHEIDLKRGGETIPLAQLFELEMQYVYHTTFGWLFWELYLQIRTQMTHEERRLFIALYVPGPHTMGRVAALDQTVTDFILCASDEAFGAALFALSGIKRVGKVDLTNEFAEYWKTWLWLCDLVRSGSVDKITAVLGKEPKRRHQFMKARVVEVHMQDEGIGHLTERLAAQSGTSGIFMQDRILAGDLDVEEKVLQHIVDERPSILARLINKYPTPYQRIVLYQKFLSLDGIEPTQQEIAQRLGISQAAVSQRLKAGLKALRRGVCEEEEAGLVNWQDVLEL